MKANEAAKIAKERAPIYHEEIKEKAYKEIMRRITEAANRGHEHISGGWDLVDEWPMSTIIDDLKEEGYYVRYKYTGGGMNICVAWGEYGEKCKKSDEDTKNLQFDTKKKKWWQKLF